MRTRPASTALLCLLVAACADDGNADEAAPDMLHAGGAGSEPSMPATQDGQPSTAEPGNAAGANAAPEAGAGGSGMTPASMPPRDAGGGDAEPAEPPTQSPPAGDCLASEAARRPFGCAFAWGTNDPGGSLAGYDYLDFMSKWVGYETDANGALASCDGCAWLRGELGALDLVPVYYAYFIGFLGHENGFQDGNQNPDGPNLTTDGARLIREHRQTILEMYAWYAAQSQEAWPERPLVWLLEGDFVQYTGESQREPLSYAELARFTADVTCAIKSNMPNAVVAINHSTWNPDQVTRDFWNAMAAENVAYDLVWTTGVADNDGFLEAGATPDIYNAATATYAYLHELTGRAILVDTSFGLSAMADSWSRASPAVLNARIADGVIATNVATANADYQAALATLRPGLDGLCEAP